jgi:hypothetical protein
MANELSIDGRMKVGTFKKNFMEKFGVGVRVYTGKKFASDDVTLSSIRTEGAKGGKVKLHGRTKVGNVEKMFKEQLGIKIQIENKAGDLADNSLSLAQAGK